MHILGVRGCGFFKVIKNTKNRVFVVLFFWVSTFYSFGHFKTRYIFMIIYLDLRLDSEADEDADPSFLLSLWLELVDALFEDVSDEEEEADDDPLPLLLPNLNRLPALDEGVSVSSHVVFEFVACCGFSSLFVLPNENELLLGLDWSTVVAVAVMMLVVALSVNLIELKGCAWAALFMKLANVLDESVSCLFSAVKSMWWSSLSAVAVCDFLLSLVCSDLLCVWIIYRKSWK